MTSISTDVQGTPTHTLDVSKVKLSCPVFLSTYKEVLRVYSTAVSARLVMDDHVLDGQYILKKGSTVIMQTSLQHHSSAIWSSSSDTFNHLRFTKENPSSQTNFRAFRGGTTLCPGQNFATTEILAFTAVMIMQLYVQPKSSQWATLSTNKVELREATPSPDEDFEVDIRLINGQTVRRNGYLFCQIRKSLLLLVLRILSRRVVASQSYR